jgi:hypothetical protein
MTAGAPRASLHELLHPNRTMTQVGRARHFNYYAVPGNLASLGVFRDRVLSLWWRTVRRRSQKRRISWTRILELAMDSTTASAPSLS